MARDKLKIKAELLQKDDNKCSDISEWKYQVDQDIVPDWYEVDPEKYKQEEEELKNI